MLDLFGPPRRIGDSSQADGSVRCLLVAGVFAVVGTSSLIAQEGGAPALTEPPNLCEALPAADAAEIVGSDVGEGMRPDVAGFPCVYETTDGQRLGVVAHLARGPELEGTQTAIELEYCGAEKIREIPDLGIEAALFRNSNPDCGDGHTLWVATDIRFEAELYEMPRTGQLHLVLSLEPESDAERLVAVLGEAARRVMAGLQAP